MTAPVHAQTDPGHGPLPKTQRRGLTLRSVLLGLVLVVGLDGTAIYLRYVYHGSLMTYSHIPMAMLIVFTLLIFATAVAGRLTGFVLSPSEWHTILAMGVVGATVPGYGVTGHLIGLMAAPYYYQLPYRTTIPWEVHVHPYLPGLALPD